MPAEALDELYDYDPEIPCRHPEIGENHRDGRGQRRQDQVQLRGAAGAARDRLRHDPGQPEPEPDRDSRYSGGYHSLEEIDRPVDMVEVFRPKEELYAIAEKAIAIGAKVLWGQIGVYDDRRRQTGRGRRAEDGDESLPQDRVVPPVLETSPRSGDLNRSPLSAHDIRKPEPCRKPLPRRPKKS